MYEFRRPPALTTGLPIFLILFQLASYKFETVQSLGLARSNFWPPSLDLLNRLSFYTCVHLNWFHLATNILSLVPLLWEFETEVGTVRAGIVLNVLSVLPGLCYGAIATLIRLDTGVVGSSGWCFSFLAWSACKLGKTMPVLPLGDKVPVKIPTWSYPFGVLALTTLLFPFSSLLGHVIGLGFGYLLAFGYLGFAIDGTSGVVRWIEAHIEPVITGLSKIVVWIKEIDARPDEGYILGTA